MAFVNTGYARNKILTITRGEQQPRSYNICDTFPRPDGSKYYSQITDEQFARLAPAEYYQRRSDFILYVYSCEEGLESYCPDLTIGSEIKDTDLCPVPIVSEGNEPEET